jgi:hypothetical protein
MAAESRGSALPIAKQAITQRPATLHPYYFLLNYFCNISSFFKNFSNVEDFLEKFCVNFCVHRVSCISSSSYPPLCKEICPFACVILMGFWYLVSDIYKKSLWVLIFVRTLYRSIITQNSPALNMTAFWDIAPCGLVKVDRRFRDAYCLYLQGSLPWLWGQYAPLNRRSTSTRLYGAIPQKALIFILATVRTWNLTFVTLLWKQLFIVQ